MTTPQARTLLGQIGVMLAVTTIVVACGTEVAPSSTAEQSSPSATPTTRGGPPRTTEEAIRAMPRVNAELMRQAWAGNIVDYTPLPVSDAVAQAELVVTGTVEAIVEGRVDGARSMAEPGAARNAVLVLNVAEVMKGDVRGDRVYVELYPGIYTAGAMNKVVPRGLPLLVMAAPAPESTEDYPFGDNGAGRPPGEPLYAPVNPSALVFATGRERGVLRPVGGELLPEAAFRGIVERARAARP